MSKSLESECEKLRARWSPDLINTLVIALNEGNSIEPLLREVAVHGGRKDRHRLDLRGVDFSHQNLRGPWRMQGENRTRIGINLKGADLTGADMSWAILPRADLHGARLVGVDFHNAELILADLSEADLTGADLNEAWLLDTRFQNAKIEPEQLKARRNLGQLDFDYHAYEL